MKLSEEERQLLEVVREQNANDQVRLLIQREQGAWEVELSTPPDANTVRGVGRTFAEAWENMAPIALR